ncbi:ef-hand protein [Anaeramoeba ignava]|uniref:Ef-hand protein n=1 Tax=Anaeramoeba ignava TaxID=1746090 RepID=A0A9Q0R974_ANAIG|nr:ef-hand protein [Anaeramoeba ignava]
MSELTQEQKEKLQEVFDLFDYNLDGKIEFDQLGSLIRAAGQFPTDTEIQEIIENFKQNETEVDFDKFLELIQRFEGAKEQKEEELIKAFSTLDKENNGFVLASDLRYALTKLGTPLPRDVVTQMIKEVGMDSDGKINYKEFVKMMIQK